MSQQPQPTIKVEHFCPPEKKISSSGSKYHSSSHSSKSRKTRDSSSTSPSSSNRIKPSSKNNAFLNPTFGESSQILNLNQRRKSSPCIGEWPLLASGSAGGHHSRATGGTSPHSSGLAPSRTPPNYSEDHRRSPHHSRLRPDKSNGGSSGHYHQRRRLSSPPSFDHGLGHSNDSSGSNHSSGHGSLQQLAIGGLNTSSTDIRANTVRSGHSQIQTLYAPNNVTYPENISINVMNAPDNSTVQCDCGHINCPLCNLMMSLELTDPELLK